MRKRLRFIPVGAIVALALLATGAQATGSATTVTGVPVLGSAVVGSVGFGHAHPVFVSCGGQVDSANHLHWKHWGAKQATAEGTGPWGRLRLSGSF